MARAFVTLLPGWAEGVAEWINGSAEASEAEARVGATEEGEGAARQDEPLVARLGLSNGVAEWMGKEGDVEGGAVSSSRGWAFRGGFLGQDGSAKSLEELGLKGKDAAEVWWGEVKV